MDTSLRGATATRQSRAARVTLDCFAYARNDSAPCLKIESECLDDVVLAKATIHTAESIYGPLRQTLFPVTGLWLPAPWAIAHRAGTMAGRCPRLLLAQIKIKFAVFQ
jgi:hypothetical protein